MSYSKAEAGLRSMRERLRKDNPPFAKASDLEAQANALCALVRKMLCELRSSRDVKQAELAGRMGLTQSAISKIETGHGDVSLRTVYRYASALGMRPVLEFKSI
jgi:DNA-binding XRE family transcriptional regulator